MTTKQEEQYTDKARFFEILRRAAQPIAPLPPAQEAEQTEEYRPSDG